MHKSEKERVIAELTERLRVSQTLIVADYRGLTMPEIDGLRGELLKHGARFSVVKNTLTRRAAEAAGADAVLAMLEGPTAIAFLESEGDPVAVAKALSDAVRTTKILVIRGGVLDGKVISADDVDNLAKLPPTDVLRAQLVGASRRRSRPWSASSRRRSATRGRDRRPHRAAEGAGRHECPGRGAGRGRLRSPSQRRRPSPRRRPRPEAGGRARARGRRARPQEPRSDPHLTKHRRTEEWQRTPRSSSSSSGR